MAKKKTTTTTLTPPAPPQPPATEPETGQFLIPGVKAEEPPAPPDVPPAQRSWTWPARSRCPRCSSVDTKRVSDDGPTQYRRCQRPICRHSFKVQGTVL